MESMSSKRALEQPRRRALARGGPAGNEILTSATAAVLTLLLLAEGVTIVSIGAMLDVHMLIGAALIPPVGLKLASTGYRFVRYYAGAGPYREQGPPLLPLRVLAPVLVTATIVVLASGVALMIVGHRSRPLFDVHKLSFFAWAAVFAVHFLSYLPRVLGSLRSDWGRARRRQVPGAGARAMLLALSLGAGLALALVLLAPIQAWHR